MVSKDASYRYYTGSYTNGYIYSDISDISSTYSYIIATIRTDVETIGRG